MADAGIVRRVAFLILVGALAATSTALAVPASEPYPCDPSQSVGPFTEPPPLPPETRFVMDGDLYAIVTSANGLIAGWSGPPVLSFDGAFQWLRAMGVKADIFSAAEIPGATFGDGGSRSDFFFECKGSYTARAVVRPGRYPIQFALYDQRGNALTRAFHSPRLQLPLRAVVEVRFTHPLGRHAPTLLVDRNGDRRWDGRVALRPGAGELGP